MPTRNLALTPAQCRGGRGMLDWTQEELAERAHVSRSTVRDFEKGRHELNPASAAAIVAAFEAGGLSLIGPGQAACGVCLREAGAAEAPPRMPESRAVLGAEHDLALRARLRRVLDAMGAVPAGDAWGVGGSQELARWDFLVEGRPLRVEAETYLGLSLSGAGDIVDRIVAALGDA